MRVRLMVMAVCALLAVMMFGGTAFAVINLGLSTAQKYAKIGETRQAWSPGQHLIASAGNDLYALTLENRAEGAGRVDLVLYHSPDAGITWADKTFIEADTDNFGQALAVDPVTKIAHVLWSAYDEFGVQTLYYANSSDKTPIPVAYTNAYLFSITVDTDGTPHVVYAPRDGYFYYSYLNLSSGAFTPPAQSTLGNNYDELDLGVMRSDNTIYLVVSNYISQIELWKKPYLSDTFVFESNVSSSAGRMPSIAVYSNVTAKDIYVAYSSASGISTRHYNQVTGSWVQPSPVVVYSSGDNPSIAVGTDSIPVITSGFKQPLYGPRLKLYRHHMAIKRQGNAEPDIKTCNAKFDA